MKQRHQQGFTLPELMLVLCILTLLVVAAFYVQTMVSRSQHAEHDRAMIRAVAINLAQTFGPTYSVPAGANPMIDYMSSPAANVPGCGSDGFGGVACWSALADWTLGVGESYECPSGPGACPPWVGRKYRLTIQLIGVSECEALLGGGTQSVGAVGVSPLDGAGNPTPFNTPLKNGADVANYCENQYDDSTGYVDAVVMNFTTNGAAW